MADHQRTDFTIVARSPSLFRDFLLEIFQFVKQLFYDFQKLDCNRALGLFDYSIREELARSFQP